MLQGHPPSAPRPLMVLAPSANLHLNWGRRPSVFDSVFDPCWSTSVEELLLCSLFCVPCDKLLDSLVFVVAVCPLSRLIS